jgi:prepilin-type N-terminal cleavage/methylation domain-containing protein
MKHHPITHYQSGFTLIELLTALGIFLVICGAAFTLLGTTQKRYQSDSQVLNSFQEARLGMDQMVRDINDAGFPPPSYFATTSTTNQTQFASTPFAFSPYPSSCQVASSCTTPGEFDLIIQTNIDPQNTSTVSWIRYQLVGTTLMRGVSAIVANEDPTSDAQLSQAMTPYVQNVMNNSPTAQLQAAYPAIFSSGVPVPVFTYTCDSSTGPQSCLAIGGTPGNIRDITITLIVMAPVPDGQSGLPRLVQLNGRGRRINPSQ